MKISNPLKPNTKKKGLADLGNHKSRETEKKGGREREEEKKERERGKKEGEKKGRRRRRKKKKKGKEKKKKGKKNKKKHLKSGDKCRLHGQPKIQDGGRQNMARRHMQNKQTHDRHCTHKLS